MMLVSRAALALASSATMTGKTSEDAAARYATASLLTAMLGRSKLRPYWRSFVMTDNGTALAGDFVMIAMQSAYVMSKTFDKGAIWAMCEETETT